MGNKNNSDSNNPVITGLPIFQLCGGDKATRKHFLKRLLKTLAQGGLQGEIVTSSSPDDGALVSLVKRFDLVLLDGRSDLPLQQIELGRSAEGSSAALNWSGGEDREFARFYSQLVAGLDDMAAQTPLWACILIGGKSSRMGRPKHLLTRGAGGSWLEATVELLNPMVDGLVVSGRGEVPEGCAELIRVPDIPGVFGPLSGILSASRWNPLVNWLVVACDMPFLSVPAVQWLLAERRSGIWGWVPRLGTANHCEPLFALYNFRAGQLFENQFLAGRLRVGEVAAHKKIANPVIPDALAAAWQNINSPDQLSKMRGQADTI